LFFFLNGEFEKGSKPGITWSPKGGSGVGNISATSVDSLRKFSDILKSKYGYDPGAYDNFPNFENKNRKFLGKIDWNINSVHKLTVKYSDFESNNDVALNNSSVPNGGGFTATGRSGTISRLPYNRFSANSMAFANSNYGFKDVVRTGTVELNSNFGGKMANQFLATVSKINTVRTNKGGIYPSIDIFDGKGNNYMSAGMDPYTYNNEVVNDIYSITDNFTYYLGNHTLTAGGTYEYQKVGNMFMAGSNGYYAYNSLDDFANDRAPIYYAYTYSLVPGVKNPYSAELKVGQLGLYIQDEIQVSKALNVTLGVRADKAIYHEQPIANPEINKLALYNQHGQLTNYDSGSWPKSRVLLSPRVGFRWDALNNNSLVVRGGTGLFTGRIPFVFLTNMPTNSGMYQFGGAIKDPAILAGIKFNSNPDAYADLFPKTAGTTVPSNIVLMDPDFKFPQVIRTNIAVDKELGNGLTLTLEGLHTKDINGVKMRNANLKAPTGIIKEGSLIRSRYVDTNGDNKLDSKDRSLYSNTTTAIVLENTDKGYSTALTAMLSKNFSNGFYGSVAYNFTHAEEVTGNPGSQASSVWNSNPNVGTSNAVEMGYSQYGVPHRVVANLSYRKEYAKHFATTISLFYEGSHQARYSFVVNGDLNGDGNSSTDLMYIPRNASEMNFEAYDEKDKAGNILHSFSVEQQEKAFEQFINNSSYLKNHRGQFAERNAALTPWYNRFDVRLLQDFYVETGKNNTKHTLQFTADVLNVSNLLNKNWGIQQRYITNNPLQFQKIDGESKPVYRLQHNNGNLVTDHIQDNISTSSTWSMQLGLRYSF